MSDKITSQQLRELASGLEQRIIEITRQDIIASFLDAAALIDEQERRIGALTEALHLAISIAEDHIHSEYDGTGLVNGLLEQLGPCRYALLKDMP